MLDKIGRIPENLMRHWQAIALYILVSYGLGMVYRMLPKSTLMYALERGLTYGVGMIIWDLKF